ncbi:hypothetical protein F5148DRAFT_1155170, partial [Russula earlei]
HTSTLMATLPIILAAVGLYIFDHLARIAWTWYTTAWLTAKNALNGSTMLGAGSDSSGMMLPVKAQGSWTRGLLCMSEDVVDACPEKEVHVIIKGPYRNFEGSPGYTLYHTASTTPDDCDIQECLEHNAYDTPLKKGPKPL